LALTSPTSGGRSVGIVRSRTKATKFSFIPSELQDNGTKVYTDSLPSLQSNAGIVIGNGPQPTSSKFHLLTIHGYLPLVFSLSLSLSGLLHFFLPSAVSHFISLIASLYISLFLPILLLHSFLRFFLSLPFFLSIASFSPLFFFLLVVLFYDAVGN
jgi:hypothetical protein